MESTVVPAPGPRHRFDGRGVRALLLPFVAMGALVIVAAAAVTVGGGAILGFGDGTAVIRDPLTFGIGAGIAVGTIILGIVIAGRHLPAWVDAGPLVLSVVAVAFMRDGTGGGTSGFTPLFLVPVLWVALYDSRRQLAIVLVAVLLALVVPILGIGGDAYPTAELRRMTVFMGVALLIGVTVQNLVDRMRAAIAGEAARSADVAAQEARLRAILDTASDAVITLEPGGRIVDLNPAAIDMLRGGREALIGRNLIETLADDDAKDQLRAGMDRLVGDGGTAATRRFQTRLARVDGERFPADVSVGVVRDKDRILVHAFARDASDRVAAEAAASQQLEDLRALLAVGRELGNPERARSLRASICSAALAVGGASMTLLFEPDGADLVLTASAGRAVTVERVRRDGGSSGVARVAATGAALFAGRLAGDSRLSRRLTVSTGANAGYWQPIHGPAGVAGVLVVLWDEEVERLSPRVQALLNILASQAEVALEMSKLVGRLEGLARTDGLTGIANRRTFDETAEAELERAHRAGRPLSLVMLDLDEFKQFNDTHGHLAGDRLLRSVTAAWEAELRPADLLARYGGEEFAVILPDSTADAAVLVADRLRATMPRPGTVSAGVAAWQPGESVADLVARADAALYRAKAAGRDRVIAA